MRPPIDCQFDQLLANPTDFIHSLFPDHPDTPSLHKKASDIIGELKVDQLNRIPLLNITSPFEDGKVANRSLVRFRCIIQDMFDPEFYVASTGENSGRKCGLYLDSLEEEEEHANPGDTGDSSPRLKDRLKYLAISVPGESAWVTEFESSNDSTASAGPPNNTNDSSNRPQFTRQVTDGECTANCFPLPGKNLCAYMLLVYEDNVNIKLNEMLNVIGIIDYSDEGELMHPKSDIFQELGKNDFRPPRNIVPVIHVIHRSPLTHINPLPLEVTESKQVFFENCKSHLEAILGLIFQGDSLASHYVICGLVSHVFTRRDLINVGAFPLGLTIGSSDNSNVLVRALVTLFGDVSTHSAYLPLTLEKLNGKPLLPKKNYSTEKLHAAPLQLAAGTVLLIDETVMTSGQLNEQGVRNIASLRDLIQWQQLKYDFEYHVMEVDVDVPIFVVSQAKSLLQVPLTLPVDRKLPEPKDLLGAIKEYLTPHLLQALRCYLTLAREAQVVIGEEVQRQIQSDFVKMRQENGSKVNGETLHQLMSLARLVSVTLGEEQLSVETWNNALAMEDERLARLVSRAA